MRYYAESVLTAAILTVGCNQSDDPPKEIVFRIETGATDRTASLVRTTRATLSMFKAPLDMYQLDIGHYPSTADGLMALRTKPPGKDARKWEGPYLEKDPLPDAWDNRFRYLCPGEHNSDSYDIWSTGPDGIEGTTDDIGNW